MVDKNDRFRNLVVKIVTAAAGISIFIALVGQFGILLFNSHFLTTIMDKAQSVRLFAVIFFGISLAFLTFIFRFLTSSINQTDDRTESLKEVEYSALKSFVERGPKGLQVNFNVTTESKATYEFTFAQYHFSIERLTAVVKDLNKKGTVNLFIGIVATVCGLGIMLVSVFMPPQFSAGEIYYASMPHVEDSVFHKVNNSLETALIKKLNNSSLAEIREILFLNNPTLGSYSSSLEKEHDSSNFLAESLKYYGTRLSIVLFLELFAYFFLRLYKNCLDDIKYFQNEITNLENMYMALHMALIQKEDEPATLGEILKLFAKTERNFTLAKGQSTISIEKQKIDASQNKTMSDLLVQALTSALSSKSEAKQ